MKNLKILSLLFSLLFLTSCEALRGIFERVPQEIDRTQLALQSAITQLDNHSASWQQTLRDLTGQLTEEAQQTIRNEVSDMLNRAIAATGVEVRCDVDFFRNRIRQDLQRLLDKVRGRSPSALPPVFCHVIPRSIQLSLDPNRRNVIEYYGYDFDRTLLSIELYDVNGAFLQNLTHLLAQQTHYGMTLNLAGAGTLPNNGSIVLKFNGTEVSRVSVVQEILPPCRTYETTINPNLPGYTVYRPPHTYDDADFGGDLNIESATRIFLEDNAVKATIKMWGKECCHSVLSGWNTTVDGISRPEVIYSAPSGMMILRILSTPEYFHSYQDHNQSADWFAVGGDTPILSLDYVGDTDGAEAGTRTQVKVEFKPIRVEVKETLNCRN